jgi:hypothetical protein
MLQALAIVQGFYYLLTGVWPLVHMPSFVWITGPKLDVWLVRTAGVLITAISLPLIVAGFRDNVTPEIVLLAVGAAAGLTFIDVYYSLKGVISKVYLVDAVPEVILIILWCIAIAVSR